jgi:phosphoribosylformylglycinamidine cyclo-ligase
MSWCIPENIKSPIQFPGVDVNVGKLVLSPTRTYAPIMIEIFKELRQHIHGLVHCSGGAQTKVLHFIDDPSHY